MFLKHPAEDSDYNHSKMACSIKIHPVIIRKALYELTICLIKVSTTSIGSQTLVNDRIIFANRQINKSKLVGSIL